MRAVAVLAIVAGCTSGPPCLERELTIGQGVYGVVTALPTDTGAPGGKATNFAVTVRNDPEGVPTAFGVTDDDGVYQVVLLPGTHFLCQSRYDSTGCVAISLVGSDLVRADLFTGPGGHWEVSEPSGCAD